MGIVMVSTDIYCRAKQKKKMPRGGGENGH